ncbi:hypothetical protein B0H11DRAFT_690600 [Mycena galericulata]|nr:hypothetical protein B0H11DRAFT_690600 [Mycena galericulata]
MDEGAFPFDIEREIFETAALRDPKLIPTLLRLSHRVHTWIEPLLYRVLILLESTSEKSLLSIAEAKSASFLKTAVRHVSTSLLDHSTSKSLLRKSTGILNLHLPGGLSRGMLDDLAETHIRKLAFSPTNFSDLPPLDHPVFLSLTHLDLYVISFDEDALLWEKWSSLASLPELTHLCFSDLLSDAILPQVIVECPRLLVIVTAYWYLDFPDEAKVFAEALTVTDPRVVVMAITENYIVDWERGAREGIDFWVPAEDFVNRKRRGEVESTCYLLEN